MAVQVIDLSINRGNFLFDESTSSSFQVPAAYCADLVGCGVDTHQAHNVSWTLNSRVDCESPVRALQYSNSGYAAIADAQANPIGYAGQVAGVGIDVSIGKVVRLLAQSIQRAITVADYVAALGVPAANVQRLGGQFVVKNNSRTRRTVATVNVVSVSEAKDKCGNVEGYRASTSVSVFGFDLTTCKPSLLWQTSPTLFAGTEAYTGTPNAETIYGNAMEDGMTMNAFYAALNPATCANIQDLAITGWSGYEGRVFTIGTTQAAP